MPQGGALADLCFPQARVHRRPVTLCRKALPARNGARAGEDIAVATHLQLGFSETTKAFGVGGRDSVHTIV